MLLFHQIYIDIYEAKCYFDIIASHDVPSFFVTAFIVMPATLLILPEYGCILLRQCNTIMHSKFQYGVQT